MEWLRAVLVSFVLPITVVSIPPIVYPHLLCFVLPCIVWVFACFLLLCFGRAITREDPGSSTQTPPPSATLADGPQLVFPVAGDDAPDDDAESSKEARGRFNVVNLARLLSALEEKPAEEVLAALYNSDEYLDRVPATMYSFAIISYRQLRVPTDSFTLDVAAFRDAVATAKKAGVAAIWLDAWCYRQVGAYDHSAFCAELGMVMKNVSAVLWLPVTRAGCDAKAGYQFRLWCSFEASVVALRRLPVFVAGQGMTRAQRLLRRWGVFYFALPGVTTPPEVRTLAYVNLSLLIMCLCLPAFIPVVGMMIKAGVYAQFVPSYLHDLALARNAQSVLQAMADGIARGHERAALVNSHGSTAERALAEDPEASTSNNERMSATTPMRKTLRPNISRRITNLLASMYEQSEKDDYRFEALGADLPWLPAFDRRDALVVRSLLNLLGVHGKSISGGGAAARDASLCALAVSCYAAARLQPSDGDPVGEMDVGSWFAQKAIVLPSHAPIRLTNLKKHGWYLNRGSPDILGTPTGRLRVSVPASVSSAGGASTWDASAAHIVEPVPAAVQTGALIYLALAVCPVALALVVGGLMDLMNLTSEPVMMIALAFATAAYLLGGLVFFISINVLPWVYNFPHPIHSMAFGKVMAGTIGYEAPKELALMLFCGYNILVTYALLFFGADTKLFTSFPPSDLFRLNATFTFDLAVERHADSNAAATVIAYAGFLMVIQYWQIIPAVWAGHLLWHTWHQGRRNGRRFFLQSPDTKATVVSFFAQAVSLTR